MLSSILYEDSHLLILNKPSGIAVHGGSGLRFGIIEILRIIKPNYKFLELIHRLDRNTSGVLLLAKKKSILKDIHEQFRKNKIYKKYLAVVHGNFTYKRKIVVQPLTKIKNQNKKNIVYINQIGKKSITIFEKIKNFDNTTLLTITPKTGRMHQIRVHAAYINHPIVFDPTYGNHILDNAIDKSNKIKKILLHAFSITFYYEKIQKRFFIHAPLQNEFNRYLKIQNYEFKNFKINSRL